MRISLSIICLSARPALGFVSKGNIKSASFRPPHSAFALNMGILDSILGGLGLPRNSYADPCIMGDESIMSKKSHGTSETPVQSDLRWNCDQKTHYAEYKGYWQSTTFLEEEAATTEITFYDSNTGKPLFVAPRGRSMVDFIKETQSHGWPSFRDSEVIWDDVRVLSGGEAVSHDGTHLGHNLPDAMGNRYCINLVSVAGRSLDDKEVD